MRTANAWSRPLSRTFFTGKGHVRWNCCLPQRLAIWCQSKSNFSQASARSDQLRITSRKFLKQLSSLELAIGELATLAGLSAVGTLIKQNMDPEYYVQNFPEGSLLDFHLIWALQWDHIYTANYFLALLALLSGSLAACSITRQWPMVKVARRWRLAGSAQRVASSGSGENSVTLPDADVTDFGRLLRCRGYAVFLREGSMYAFKGLAGKMAPIGVHVSLLLTIAGVTISALGGLEGSVMVPQDGDFNVAQALRPKSPLARPSSALKEAKLHVDKFEINYRPDGSIGQFTSEVSVRNIEDRNLEHKTITVNDPLRYQGFTAYQTDWSIAAVTLRVRGLASNASQDAAPFNLPVASLEGQTGVSGKLWATFLPAETAKDASENPRGISLVMRDLQTVALYDSQGQFVGIRRPGSGKPIEVKEQQFLSVAAPKQTVQPGRHVLQVEGLQIVVDDLIGSTGLELKVDPGVPYVYAGFAGLMVTTALSYLSHSQVWALQEGNLLHISGKTNRAKVSFQKELAALVEMVPEKALTVEQGR